MTPAPGAGNRAGARRRSGCGLFPLVNLYGKLSPAAFVFVLAVFAFNDDRKPQRLSGRRDGDEVVGIFLAKDDPIGFEERVLPVDPNVMLHHDQPVALADAAKKPDHDLSGFAGGKGAEELFDQRLQAIAAIDQEQIALGLHVRRLVGDLSFGPERLVLKDDGDGAGRRDGKRRLAASLKARRAVGSPGGQESFRGAFEAAGRAAQRVFFGMGSELRHDDDLGISHALDPQGLRIDDDGAGGLDWKGKAQEGGGDEEQPRPEALVGQSKSPRKQDVRAAVLHFVSARFRSCLWLLT